MVEDLETMNCAAIDRVAVDGGQPSCRTGRPANESRPTATDGIVTVGAAGSTGERTVKWRNILLRPVVGALALGMAWTEPVPGQMPNFRSLSDAEDAADRIMDAAGLRTVDFVVLVHENSNNAAAGISTEEPYANRRIILYDPLFLQKIERQTDEWGPMSIMAHEIAHHLLGHSVFGAGSKPSFELDADFYTGFILNRLGADLEQAQAALRLIASPSGSSSHPPLHKRLDAIGLGWNKAREGDAVRVDQALENLKRELRQLEDQLSDAEDRFSDAEDRRLRAETELTEALEQLGQAQEQGGLTRERRREMEKQVQATEERLQEAKADREQALAELNRSRSRAGDAMERADKAFVIAALLVPLVLVSLVLAMRKPRHEVGKMVERVTSRHVDAGGNDGGRRRGGHGGDQQSDNRLAAGRRQDESTGRPIPAAPPFNGSGLERCAEKDGFVLGRDAYLVDAVLNHSSVSRRHARLTRFHGRLYIEDLNSANGTWVNGRRIQQFVPTVLAPGDTVTLGPQDVALWGRKAVPGGRW